MTALQPRGRRSALLENLPEQSAVFAIQIHKEAGEDQSPSRVRIAEGIQARSLICSHAQTGFLVEPRSSALAP